MRRALGHDLTAMYAGGRADIDDVVGRQDRILVMLDDNDGIADIAQMLQRFEKAGIVALVQADGGFVEHVEDAAVRPEPICDASRMRWLLPPDSVPELRDRLR